MTTLKQLSRLLLQLKYSLKFLSVLVLPTLSILVLTTTCGNATEGDGNATEATLGQVLDLNIQLEQEQNWSALMMKGLTDGQPRTNDVAYEQAYFPFEYGFGQIYAPALMLLGDYYMKDPSPAKEFLDNELEGMHFRFERAPLDGSSFYIGSEGQGYEIFQNKFYQFLGEEAPFAYGYIGAYTFSYDAMVNTDRFNGLIANAVYSQVSYRRFAYSQTDDAYDAIGFTPTEVFGGPFHGETSTASLSDNPFMTVTSMQVMPLFYPWLQTNCVESLHALFVGHDDSEVTLNFGPKIGEKHFSKPSGFEPIKIIVTASLIIGTITGSVAILMPKTT